MRGLQSAVDDGFELVLLDDRGHLAKLRVCWRDPEDRPIILIVQRNRLLFLNSLTRCCKIDDEHFLVLIATKFIEKGMLSNLSQLDTWGSPIPRTFANCKEF